MTEVYENALATCFPDVELRDVRLLAQGWDSVVLEVGGDLIFRFPRYPHVHELFLREMELLHPKMDHASEHITRPQVGRFLNCLPNITASQYILSLLVRRFGGAKE